MIDKKHMTRTPDQLLIRINVQFYHIPRGIHGSAS